MMRPTAEKTALFRSLFPELANVHGAFDPSRGRARQVKRAVTDRVVLACLQGSQPCGVCLLVKGRTRAVVADFDHNVSRGPMESVSAARAYELLADVERFKSKVYHVWTFFGQAGSLALKALAVVHRILAEMEKPRTGVFLKRDVPGTTITCGNFFHAPLFSASRQPRLLGSSRAGT